MIDGYSAIENLRLNAAVPFPGNRPDPIGIHSPVSNGKVEEEFLAIFYKELLKQSFKPSFGLEEDENSFPKTFSRDLLIERMALELAKSKSYSLQNLFPNSSAR